MKLFNKIKKCKKCKNKNISLILNFGLVPLGNDLNKSKVFKMTEDIYLKVIEVLTFSDKKTISTNESAMKLAQDRIIRKKKSS